MFCDFTTSVLMCRFILNPTHGFLSWQDYSCNQINTVVSFLWQDYCSNRFLFCFFRSSSVWQLLQANSVMMQFDDLTVNYLPPEKRRAAPLSDTSTCGETKLWQIWRASLWCDRTINNWGTVIMNAQRATYSLSLLLNWSSLSQQAGSNYSSLDGWKE